MANRVKDVPIKTGEELRLMHRAGMLAAKLRRELGRRVAPGVTTMELNDFAEDYLSSNRARPAQKGYLGYPYAICAAVNDVVCHGLPEDRPLRTGDLVTLDFALELDGWMADTAYTYSVGRIRPEAERLRGAAYQAMNQSIQQAFPGKRLGDIAAASIKVAKAGGYGIVTQFGGHGIGREMHEPPQVPFVGFAGKGMTLKKGMVITIEPMLTIGPAEITVRDDGWTVQTEKGGWAAQFEHTVAITEQGPFVLTR
jgi:methionyl aminopeptidase